MQHPPASPLFFVQVRPQASERWTTQGVADSPEVAEQEACGAWRLPVLMTGADCRVVSEEQLELEGGMVAVAEAVASFHAEALRACRWLPLAAEIVSGTAPSV
jgi:hypothetical protein